ncbi:WD40-repeat-containing domain protein [Mycena floridula]|nr:WD40-repeat-containing domain protein [Mycena floridula]
MPDLPLGSQVFDLVFHPTITNIYAGLLNGNLSTVTYDHYGDCKISSSLGLSKRSLRAVTINQDGSRVFAAGKGKSIFTVDTETNVLLDSRKKAHEAPINRVKHLLPWLFSTGDDEGTIKLWDPRKAECIQSYGHHFDYITDFLWLEDGKLLVATSGDGTLSVMDVRSKKTQPIAQSEDQDDELLSLLAIKGGAKIVVGTQIGMLSVFNRKSGWGDCVDRLPGHPQSVDTLCALPQSLSNVDTDSTILSGSSDGLVRAVQIFPTKLLGVIADHGEFPVERIAIGEGISIEDESTGAGVKKNQGRWWLGSVGHDEKLKMTALEELFEEDDEEEEEEEGDSEDPECPEVEEKEETEQETETVEKEQESDEDSDVKPVKGKRKKQMQEGPKTKKGKRNTVEAEVAFFDELS